MRARLTVLGAALLVAGCGGSGNKASKPPPPPPPPPPSAPTTASIDGATAKLVAPGHTVKVNAKWNYRVELTGSGDKPTAGKVTVQIADPLGRAHPVQYDETKQNIVARPFRGSFHDYIQFPPDARGYTLTVRVIVATAGGKHTFDYPVKPT